MREFQDTASPAVVSLYSVVPAFIATNDGGATPVDQTTAVTGFICQLCNISVNSLLIFGYFRLNLVLLYRKICDICGTGCIFIFYIVTLVIFA